MSEEKHTDIHPEETPKNIDSIYKEDPEKLSGMFRSWFVGYASYVIQYRAIPHIDDGLKPVQRRVLHAMRRAEDGRYNKVAGIVGDTMKFHPHGDASIGSALVNMGQKELLIDTQGNWGNILTGDGAAAVRYIEARLSPLSLEAVFNPKTTTWTTSYDGRNQEPVALPVKFPLLLAQGSKGIGVGLNSIILPHNFRELLEVSIDYLKGKTTKFYPDFQTGCMIDVDKYNDGQRGGKIRMRTHIEKVDSKTLKITDTPYDINTSELIESILSANEKGKIKIKSVHNNTTSEVEIIINLESKTSSDKTIDALYAFTKCEISISPNCCVINNNKPHFLSVTDILQHNTDRTKALLRQELDIELHEIKEQLHYNSLEELFIKERIYKDKEFENAKTNNEALAHIAQRLEPFKKDFIREVTNDDLLKLLEIKMARILRFNEDKAEEIMLNLRHKMEVCQDHIDHITLYTIDWYKYLLKKYGKDHPRLTEIRSFETIQANKVVIRNEKLYVNRKEGFVGIGLKKSDQVEEVCKCSDIDDIIVFLKDGTYKVLRIADKVYVGPNIIHVAVFIKNDKRTIYNCVYRDGLRGTYYIKRFAVNGVTRDKDYTVTKGSEGSKIMYFTANSNGEAEMIKITLKAQTRGKRQNMEFEKDFSEILIKGRNSMGNILTKAPIRRITLSQKGSSTLGGRKVWYDPDVMRLNYDERGQYLGMFEAKDLIVVITNGGTYYTTNFDLTNHYSDVLRLEKFDPHKIWSVALHDADNKNNEYIKRFQIEPSTHPTSFIGDNAKSNFWVITDTVYPRFKVIFDGSDDFREDLIVDVDDFVGIKSTKAKGKRVTTFHVSDIIEIEPTRFPEPEPEPEEVEEIEDDRADDDDETPSLFDENQDENQD